MFVRLWQTKIIHLFQFCLLIATADLHKNGNNGVIQFFLYIFAQMKMHLQQVNIRKK